MPKKPNVIKGKPLKPNVSIEKKFKEKLKALTQAMIKQTEKDILKLFEKESPEYMITGDASISSQARILLSTLTEKFDKIFTLESKKLSDWMITQVDNHSKATIKNSLESLSEQVTINTQTLSEETKNILKASTEMSASYIKSIQTDYLDKVSNATYRSITSSKGLQSLVPEIQKIGGQTERKAELIALDQTRKVSADLDSARMKQNNITKFEWVHSGGGAHPRETHQAMNGKIYDLDKGAYDSSVGYNVLPCELPNCKCFKVPVIELGEETP